MTFRAYLLAMVVATVAAWAAWIVVLVSINPARAGAFGLVFFHATLALALIGTLSVSGAGIRVWVRQEELASRHVTRAFRQGLLITAIVMAALVMLPSGLFRWWTATLLIASAALVEMAFLGSGRSGRG